VKLIAAVDVESSAQIDYFNSQIVLDATGKQLTTARPEASSLEEEVESHRRSSNSSLEPEIQHLSDFNFESL
jgi:hypothetical protein